MKEPEADTFEDSLGSHRGEAMLLHPFLFVVLECDRPTAGGARYALHGIDQVVVGRGPERSATRGVSSGASRLALQVPGRSMSSTHARILSTPDGWVLEDARSTNGSFVNGKRVERQLLQEGDVLELGHTVFMLQTAVATPQGTAPIFDSRQSPPPAAGLATLLPALSTELAALAKFATSDLPILELGETGTGKEVIARAIHGLSGRTGPIVAVNCGALPANLVESQLFGHQRGSFSGATRDEPGFFRSAQKGTLLLDEIGDFPEAAQAALLRVLQQREVVPVGSTRPVPVDVRVIAATHRPLESLVQQGRFRSDLFARLDGHRFHLPALDARREDLGILISAILEDLTAAKDLRLSPEAGVALVSQEWPFNVRQLFQQLKRAIVLSEDGLIKASHIERGREAAVPSGSENRQSRQPKSLSAGEAKLKEELIMKLGEAGGNVTEVARQMGKARMQIQRWVRRFGIEVEGFRK
jgi:transcriptional regulator with PAS, ATPase and Fis domain